MFRMEEKSGVVLSPYKGAALPKRSVISNWEHRLGVVDSMCTGGALQMSTARLYAHVALLNVFIVQLVLYIFGCILISGMCYQPVCEIYLASLQNFDLPVTLAIGVEPCPVHSLDSSIHGVQATDHHGSGMCCTPD